MQGLKKITSPPRELHAKRNCTKLEGYTSIEMAPYLHTEFRKRFFNIERRRTKEAQIGFSLFEDVGAIELSSEFNGNLMEKAGREGFITNAAYRQLRDIMEDLFKQLAKTFFRKEADRSGEFNRIKEELQHRASLLQKREKRVKTRKAFFESSLATFFERVQSGKPDELAEEIISKITQRLDAIEKLDDAEATHDF